MKSFTFLHAALCAGLVAVITMIPAQNRLLTPAADEVEAQREQANRVRVEIERRRQEAVHAQTQERAFTALDENARAEKLRKEWDEIAAAAAEWEYEPQEDFLARALARLRVEAGADGALLLRDEAGNAPPPLNVGGVYLLPHPDASAFELRVQSLDAGAGIVTLRFGDAVYTLARAGGVKTRSTAELRASHLARLGAYDMAGPPISMSADRAAFHDVARLAGIKGFTSVVTAEGVANPTIDFRSVARPFEFTLSDLCIAYGIDDGRGVVWEKHGAEYLIRPFPASDNVRELALPTIELLRVEGDPPRAVISINGVLSEVQTLDKLAIPLGDSGAVHVLIETVSSKYHEVTGRAGGRRLLWSTMPLALGQKRISLHLRATDATIVMANLAKQAGVAIMPGEALAATPIAVDADNDSFASVLSRIAARGGWKWRWVSGEVLLVDSEANLLSSDFDRRRVEGF